MTSKKQINEDNQTVKEGKNTDEEFSSTLANRVMDVGINIGLAKAVSNVIYNSVNGSVNITKQDVLAFVVILNRLMDEISKQFELIEQEINI